MTVIKWIYFILFVCILGFGFQNCSDSGGSSGTSTVVDPGELKSMSLDEGNIDGVIQKLGQNHQEGKHEAPDDAVECGDDEDSEDGEGAAKVYICHFPKGNPDGYHTLCVGVPALRAHLSHETEKDGEVVHDVLGKCEDSESEPNLCEQYYSGDALKYHVFTSDGRCVWSCSVGTQPDAASGECQCRPGYEETGVDEFGRRVCTINEDS